jgi:hypothetical protein
MIFTVVEMTILSLSLAPLHLLTCESRRYHRMRTPRPRAMRKQHRPARASTCPRRFLKNIRFWRHHFLTEGEPLSPYFEGLQMQELPAL